jgi:hypothetical protein
MPENWRFCFEYFFSNHTNEIKYDRMPKNGLVLTNILVKNNSYKTVKGINDPFIIEKWSNILGVESSPVIFKGFLKYNNHDIPAAKARHKGINQSENSALKLYNVLLS